LAFICRMKNRSMKLLNLKKESVKAGQGESEKMNQLSHTFSPAHFLTFSLFLLSSCNIINPTEPVPAYIHIDKFGIIATPALGTDSTKLTDVYAYIDNSFQGAYPLGTSFPILQSGAHKM